MAATVESVPLNFKSDAPQLPDHNPPHSNDTPQMGPNETTPRSPPAGSNPYVAAAQSPPPSKKTMETVKGVLSKWGKKVGQAAKKTEVLSKSTWQHLKTAPSFGDAAMGRIAQGAKVIAEGGHDKIFQQTFTVSREEQLRKAYACYLSTSAGPVMGVLYLSSAKIAFCSDSPLSYKVGDKTEWTYYKVVIPLENLKEVKPSVSQVNKSEKFIQIVSIDNHEFWFLGFVNYDSAVKNLQQTLDGLLEARMQMNSPPHQQYSQLYPQAQPQVQTEPEPEPQLQPQSQSQSQPQHQTQPDVESKLEPELQKQTQTPPVAPPQPPVPLESQSQLQ